MRGKISILALVVFLHPAPAPAAPGETGFQALDAMEAPRQAAMAGASTALADDTGAALTNPAAWAALRRDEAAFFYHRTGEGLSHGGAAYGRPLAGGGVWGAQLRRVDYGDIDRYDASGLKTGGFDARDFLFAAGYGRSWSRGLAAGANLRYMRQEVAGVSGQATAVDAGLSALVLSHFRMGAAVRNVGGGARLVREKTPPPTTFTAGVAFEGFAESLRAALEVRQARGEDLSWSLGQELWIHRTLALRAGYDGEDGFGSGLTLGLGIRFKDLGVDYAFLPGAEGFDGVHRAGFSLRFGGRAEALYQEALRLMDRGEHAQAVLALKKVLDVEPRHHRALARLREAINRLRLEDGGNRP